MLQSNNNKAPGSQNTILLKCLVLRFHEPWHNNKVCVIYFSILTTETQPWMPEWCISFNKNVTFRFKALRLPEYSRYGFHPWMDNLRLPDALLVTPPWAAWAAASLILPWTLLLALAARDPSHPIPMLPYEANPVYFALSMQQAAQSPIFLSLSTTFVKSVIYFATPGA